MKEKSNQQEKQKGKKAREKSALYPSYDLSSCIEFIRAIDRLGGKGVAEGSLLSELNLKSTGTKSYSGKLSSSKQFGLLDSKAGLLSITDRARVILYPTEEQKDLQKKGLTIEAFRSPFLYQQLIRRFDGKQLPKQDTLANILMNEYKIAKNAKNIAAKVFANSAKFASVLGGDNYLQVNQVYASLSGETIPSETEVPEVEPKGAPMGQVQSLKVVLSNGKSATINVPADISKADIERLKKMLDLLVVEGDE